MDKMGLKTNRKKGLRLLDRPDQFIRIKSDKMVKDVVSYIYMKEGVTHGLIKKPSKMHLVLNTEQGYWLPI